MDAGSTVEDGQKEKTPETNADEQDLSMEEILHSIRRIIADDEDKPKSEPTTPDEDVPGSEVLELTDVVEENGDNAETKQVQKEDSSSKKAEPAKESATPKEPSEKPAEQSAPVEEKPATASTPAAASAPATSETPNDVLAKINEALAKPSEGNAASPETSQLTKDVSSLLSNEAASATATQFKKLHDSNSPPPPATTPSPPLRSGTTIEDLVMEMLRPMMKEWLDENLPQIVEHIVEREVQKLSR